MLGTTHHCPAPPSWVVVTERTRIILHLEATDSTASCFKDGGGGTLDGITVGICPAFKPPSGLPLVIHFNSYPVTPLPTTTP